MAGTAIETKPASARVFFCLQHEELNMKMSKRLRELLAKKEQNVKAARKLLDTVEAEGRDMTEEESEQHKELIASIGETTDAIAAERTLLEAEADLEGRSIDDGAGTDVIGLAAAEDPKRGFQSMGEFATAVRAAMSGPGAQVDERLLIDAAVPSTAGRESVGSDGGYAVPPQYRTDIMEAVGAEDSLFSMTDQIPIERNSIKMPVDETTPWDTTNGIQVAWEDELNQLSQSKPHLDLTEFNARKITSLVPVSEELMEDASAMDAYLRRKAPVKIQFAVDLAIVQGNGVGRPLGLLNSPALITVAKEGSQSADTIVRANINKMWARMPARNRRNAVWLINQDADPQLQELQFTGTESPIPLYMPNGGLSQTPYDTLKGRPVIYHQAANTLGSKGDIMLVDMSQYATVVKRGGIKVDVSMHLYFDANAMAYRFILRVGGHPWLKAPIDPRDGSNTLSPFVTLAERA